MSTLNRISQCLIILILEYDNGTGSRLHRQFMELEDYSDFTGGSSAVPSPLRGVTVLTKNPMKL